MGPWFKILCAVDFSEPSRRAVELAAELARSLEADLTLIHVREEPRAVLDVPLLAKDPAGDSDEARLAAWRAEAEQRAGRRVAATLARGDPAAVIADLAERDSFDAIVVGTRGRTGLQHVLMGSVAEKVVRSGPCTVIVARPTPWRGD
jgi:nucleotide-binding universal stress UspA family protein